MLLLSACAEWFSYQRAFEVTVDLTAEGERTRITRQIMCEGEVWRMVPVPGVYSIQWHATAASFGMRLPSGAAVAIVTPPFCDQNEPWEKGGSFKLRKGFIPLIAWVDDADRPNRVEAYVWKGYYDRADARVGFHGVSARVIDTDEIKPGPTDSFSWLGVRKYGARRDVSGTSYYAQVLSEQDWGSVEAVARHVTNLRQREQLPRSLREELIWKFRMPANLYARLTGSDTYELPARANPGSKQLNPQELGNLARSYPMFKTPDGYAIDPGQQGYFVYYRSTALRTKAAWETGLMPDYAIVDDITAVLNGKSMSVRMGMQAPAAIYDPVARTITIIRATAIGFPQGQ